MEEYTPGKVGNPEVYYHALYHHVAHWAAYAAMMAVLLSVGAVLSVSQITLSGFRIWGATASIGLATAGAVYFMLGMKTLWSDTLRVCSGELSLSHADVPS
jgi:hypothetical protein